MGPPLRDSDLEDLGWSSGILAKCLTYSQRRLSPVCGLINTNIGENHMLPA